MEDTFQISRRPPAAKEIRIGGPIFQPTTGYRLPATVFMNKVAKFGLVIIVIFVLMAALSPVLASWDRVQAQDLTARLESPDGAHWMGRDQLGRDLMTRIIYGARISMLVGGCVVSVSAVIGVLIGSF